MMVAHQSFSMLISRLVEPRFTAEADLEISYTVLQQSTKATRGPVLGYGLDKQCVSATSSYFG